MSFEGHSKFSLSEKIKGEKMIKLKVGDKIVLQNLDDITRDFDFNEHNELAFKNVDVHISYLSKIYEAEEDGKELIISWVDDDGDFKLECTPRHTYTYGNELVKSVL